MLQRHLVAEANRALAFLLTKTHLEKTVLKKEKSFLDKRKKKFFNEEKNYRLKMSFFGERKKCRRSLRDKNEMFFDKQKKNILMMIFIFKRF